MDSTLHSHIAGLYIQERIAEATAARLAREARPTPTPRTARNRRWRRHAKPRPEVATIVTDRPA